MKMKDLVGERSITITCGIEVGNIFQFGDKYTRSMGMTYTDADLLGVPLRIILSPRGIREGQAEICSRDKSVQEKAELDAVVSAVRQLLARLG